MEKKSGKKRVNFDDLSDVITSQELSQHSASQSVGLFYLCLVTITKRLDDINKILLFDGHMINFCHK